jgi:hypothetical protein
MWKPRCLTTLWASRACYRVALPLMRSVSYQRKAVNSSQNFLFIQGNVIFGTQFCLQVIEVVTHCLWVYAVRLLWLCINPTPARFVTDLQVSARWSWLGEEVWWHWEVSLCLQRCVILWCCQYGRNEERVIGKDLEQSGCGTMEVLSGHLPRSKEENHEKPQSV